MLFPFDRHTRRRIRLLNALQGRQLHQVYLLNAKVRKDLAREAAYGAEHFDDSLITPELLVDLRALVAHSLTAPGGRLDFGAPPSAASEVTPPSVPMLPADPTTSKGTVVIVPGGLASSLADVGPARPGLIWINGFALGNGRFRDLQLAPYAGPDQEFDLRSPKVQVSAIGAVPILYDSLAASLSFTGWTPLVFPYDWRKDMDHPTVSVALEKLIKKLGSPDKPVHIVTHSQGALVARVALTNLAGEIGCDQAKSRVGKIILLGPANYGAFVAALAVADSVKEIPMARMLTRPSARVQAVLASFTALYQLMPWNDCLAESLKQPEFDIRQPDFWKRLKPGKIEGDRLARSFPSGGNPPWGKEIDTKCFNDQITVIVGSHPFRKTPGGVHFRGGQLKVDHHFNLDGDGWVPDKLAILPGTKTYRAEGTGHIRLPMAASIINAVLNILAEERNVGLPEVNGARSAD